MTQEMDNDDKLVMEKELTLKVLILQAHSFDLQCECESDPKKKKIGTLKHDDVVVVPEFFCKEDDWSIYYKLIEEMRELQAEGADKKTEWLPWHEGCHLVTKGPDKSPTFQMVLKATAEYFGIKLESVGTRFNWYRDGKDWKPFHHDSAAFNPQRAKNQNITVGISFGSERELAFLQANDASNRTYFPQCNGMMFSFGRDVNINWKHGVNALPEHLQTGKGRISIVLWGMCHDVVEEDNSPTMVNNRRPGGHHHNKSRGGR